MKKDGLEAMLFAGMVIFTIANGILVFESIKSLHCNETLDILKRIDKKLSNAKHKS